MPRGSETRNGEVLVLFVDDDPEVRALHVAALRDNGFLVDEAVTAEEAIDVAPSLHPDVIVLDRHLPDGDGWEVARKLKALPSLRDVPILGFTHMGQRSDVETALVAGCDVFIDKPCAPETLVRYVLGMAGLSVPPSSSAPPMSGEVVLPSAKPTRHASGETLITLPSGTGRARPSR